MREIVADEIQPVVRPILGSFVSNGWSGGMLEEGPAMLALGILMGAFCGLVVGLVTLQLARFVSLSVGRNVGSASWVIIAAALDAIAFCVMMATADND